MAFLLLRQVTTLRSVANSPFRYQLRKICCSRTPTFPSHNRENSLHLSPLFPGITEDNPTSFKVHLMDDETWHVASGLAYACRGNNEDKAVDSRFGFGDEDDNRVDKSLGFGVEEPGYDDIEDMRVHGDLFYKLEKDSKEYEEYKFEFHRRKPGRNEKERKESSSSQKKGNPNQTLLPSKVEISSKKHPTGEVKAHREIRREASPGSEMLYDVGDSSNEKKQRTLTFNQLTAPYHEPFCLDIYVSKGSVRASIIHRATSKVVAVSHSISKDMKFDLKSTKNRKACVAVGKLLAQRALEDDIHNVVFTPRKGDELEGKLKIVLECIRNGGVDVKVKLKQKQLRRVRCIPPGTQSPYRAASVTMSGYLTGSLRPCFAQASSSTTSSTISSITSYYF